MKTRTLICCLAAVSCTAISAAPLTQSTFTDIIHTVDVLPGPSQNATPAQLNEVVKAPELVRTGPASRAELTAPDQTLTRIGANTVFSFAPSGREINLEQGSVLFHSPSGRGGGTIRSGGASAAVTGTTLIVVATPVVYPGAKNGFKVILLEGKGKVQLPSGHSHVLHAGELIYILPGQDNFGPVLLINLAKLVNGSALVNGFQHPLPSIGLIDLAIQHQLNGLKNGTLTDTGTTADQFASNPPQVGNGPQSFPNNGDPNIFQIGISFPPINSFNQNTTVFEGGGIESTGSTFTTGGTLFPPPKFGAQFSPPSGAGARSRYCFWACRSGAFSAPSPPGPLQRAGAGAAPSSRSGSRASPSRR